MKQCFPTPQRVKAHTVGAHTACRPCYPLLRKCLPVSLSCSLSPLCSVFLCPSCSICVWVCLCVRTIEVVLKVHRETLSVLAINNLMLTFSLPPSPVSAHLPPSASLPPLCLSQSIQLYVVGMLEVPGAPSLVPAIQTATLHLSTVPGPLKSATGKARDTHTQRSTLLNRDRQSVTQYSKLSGSVAAMLHPQTYIVFCGL